LFFLEFLNHSESPDVNGVFVLGSYAGYAVAPGSYQAKLVIHPNNTDSSKVQTSSTSITVLPNPFIKANKEDWELQQTTLATISKSIKDIHTSVNSLRRVKKQLQYYTETLASIPDAKTITDEAASIIKKIDTWESNIVESRTQNGQDVINWPSKLNVEYFYIKGLVDVSDPVVTNGVKNKLADLQTSWDKEKAKLEAIYEAIKLFNNQFKNANISALQL
jgi:hypothetical protein